jgi:hypothetical protein
VNLLATADDTGNLRYRGPYGQNACAHELGHLIMESGLTDADRSLITARYNAAKDSGLWDPKEYAMTNEREFWAVMTQFYFSACGSVPLPPLWVHVLDGPDALKQYDPETFQLVDSIYRGSANLSMPFTVAPAPWTGS